MQRHSERDPAEWQRRYHDGREMAQAVLVRTRRPDVIQLATSIIGGQRAEIQVMTDMLAKRGATP